MSLSLNAKYTTFFRLFSWCFGFFAIVIFGSKACEQPTKKNKKLTKTCGQPHRANRTPINKVGDFILCPTIDKNTCIGGPTESLGLYTLPNNQTSVSI
jgi:hypothetical protein